MDYDDSLWPEAGDAGGNGAAPWGQRDQISSEARWIWTQDATGHDQSYCRYVSHHIHLDCPAAQARYWKDYPDVAAYVADGEGGPGMEAWDHCKCTSNYCYWINQARNGLYQSSAGPFLKDRL